MNVKKILELAKYHSVDNIYNGFNLVSEAMKEVALSCRTGRIADSKEIIAIKGVWYSLPNTLIEIDRVYKDNEDYDEYTIDGLRIKFREDATYLVDYKRAGNQVILESDIPEIHELYHGKLALYVGAREKIRFNSEDSEGRAILKEFYDGIYQVDLALSRGKRRHFINAPTWR